MISVIEALQTVEEPQNRVARGFSKHETHRFRGIKLLYSVEHVWIPCQAISGKTYKFVRYDSEVWPWKTRPVCGAMVFTWQMSYSLGL